MGTLKPAFYLRAQTRNLESKNQQILNQNKKYREVSFNKFQVNNGEFPSKILRGGKNVNLAI